MNFVNVLAIFFMINVVLERVKPNLSAIPKIFCDPKFRLEDECYFNAVFFSDDFQLHNAIATSSTNPFGTSLEPEDMSNPFLNEGDENPIQRFDTRKYRILHEKVGLRSS